MFQNRVTTSGLTVLEISSEHVLSPLSTCPSLQFVYLLDNPMKQATVDDETKDYTFAIDLPFK